MSIQSAIEYAKTNPNSAYATELRTRLQTGQLDSTAQSEGFDISKYSKTYKPTAPTPNTDLANDFSKRGQNIVEGINKGATDLNNSMSGTENPLLSGAKLFVHTALNTAGQVAGGAGDIIGEGMKAVSNPNDPETKMNPQAQAFWDKVGGHLDELSKSNPDVAKALENVFNLVTLGAGGEAEAPVKSLLKDATDTTIENSKNLIGKTKGIVSKTPENGIVNDAIRQTEDTMTPTMKKQAIDEGRQTIKTTKMGGTKVDFTPTKEIDRANQILQDKNVLADPITANDAPNVVHAKTNLAIGKLGNEAEKYLEANPIKITNEEDFNLGKDLKAKAAKSSTDTQMKAYNEQWQLFQRQLKDQVKEGGYNTANYYKAIKDYEDNVASTFARGKEGLIDPEGIGSAKIQAAADIRKSVRDMIGSKHPEFQPKMYDLASLYEARDNALQSASKVKSQTFFEKYPKIKTGLELAGVGIVGDKALKGATGIGF